MQKIKILWFSNTPANADEFFNNELKDTGGWLKSLDKELQTAVDLSIAFLGNNDTPFKYKNTSYYPVKLKITRVDKLLIKCLNIHRFRGYFNECIDIINKVKPDIIHIHGTESIFGEIIGKVDIPVVVSIQGNITVYKHKYFSGIERRFIYGYLNKPINIKSLFFKNDVQTRYKLFTRQSINEKRYLAKSKYIIGRTDWDRRISSILSPDSNYYHCDEILRDSFYTNDWIPKNKPSKIIHTTTGDSVYKGLETICYALNLLNHIGFYVEWRLAGVTDNDLIVNLVKRKLKKDYPGKGLIFLGNLSGDQLTRRMLEADIYVMPSHIENSPNSLCEAMILGMPCISTFAGGSGSLLKDKEEGIVVQDGDPWSMAGAIKEMFNDFTHAVSYGQNARKKALLRHSKEKIVKDLLDIYNKIINS